MKSVAKNIDYKITGNVSEYLRINATKFPDKAALLHPVRITYKELDAEVDTYSYGLERAGITEGTRTILLLPAGPEMLFITFALLRIAAIPVLIDPGMGIKAMLDALEHLKADAFISIPKAHLLRMIRPSAFDSVKIILTTKLNWFLGAKGIKRFLDDRGIRFPSRKIEPHDIASIFFTSGSTGPAKGVIYTSGMLINQIQVTRMQFKISSEEIDLCTFPLLGLFAICHGTSSVIADMDMVHPAKLNPARVVRNINDYECSQMFGSPMVLTRLSHYCTGKNITLPTLRHIISAGAPVQKSVLEAFGCLISDEAMIHTPYGATEALPVTDITSTELALFDTEKPVFETGICVGYPIKDLEVRIIKITDDQIITWEDEIRLMVNQIGEIVVKGPWVSAEYFNKPEANKFSKIFDPADKNFWHRMGDIGRFDEKGLLWFYGRKSQRVITNKGTLYTIPCEAIFNRHPLVLRSALIGLPGVEDGVKQPVICVQLLPGNKSSKRLKQELLELGSSYRLTETISDVIFFKTFPVDPRHNAKIFREKLTVWAEKKLR
jgi:acyl-CoA synthetase (AMP-forming)/AMP-acid ligase II